LFDKGSLLINLCKNLWQTIHPLSCLSHQFLQLASRARFLKNIQVSVFLKNLFIWLASFVLGEGDSLNKPPPFCGKNYQLWCIRMKFFIESLDNASVSQDEALTSIPSRHIRCKDRPGRSLNCHTLLIPKHTIQPGWSLNRHTLLISQAHGSFRIKP